jgi:SAM-dependent methyltransferase
MGIVSKPLAIARKFLWSVRRRGAGGTLKVVLGRLGPISKERSLAKQATHPFDLKYGVQTSGLLDGTDLLSGHAHDAYNTAYWGVSPSRAQEVLRRWETSLVGRKVEAYTFLDIGCGKGRMMLIASQLPFRETIGVELNPDLASAAAKNAAHWVASGLAQSPIRTLHQDATEIALPDGPCVVFLYNPFGAPVLTKLLAHLERHFVGRPGELDILYLAPECDHVFAERGGYDLLWKADIPQSDPDEPEDIVAPGPQPCSAYRR